jgi:hypothetical protein
MLPPYTYITHFPISLQQTEDFKEIFLPPPTEHFFQTINGKWIPASPGISHKCQLKMMGKNRESFWTQTLEKGTTLTIVPHTRFWEKVENTPHQIKHDAAVETLLLTDTAHKKIWPFSHPPQETPPPSVQQKTLPTIPGSNIEIIADPLTVDRSLIKQGAWISYRAVLSMQLTHFQCQTEGFPPKTRWEMMLEEI